MTQRQPLYTVDYWTQTPAIVPVTIIESIKEGYQRDPNAPYGCRLPDGRQAFIISLGYIRTRNPRTNHGGKHPMNIYAVHRAHAG